MPSDVPPRCYTPVRSKYLMESTKHEHRDIAQDSAAGSASIAPVEYFPIFFLRGSSRTDYIPSDWAEVMREFSDGLRNAKLEVHMYPYITTLLTRISLIINEGDYEVLAFYATGVQGCSTSVPFEGQDLRPDIVAKWTSLTNARKLMRCKGKLGPDDSRVSWTETESVIEVKRLYYEYPMAQATSYAHVLSRPLPNLAGMLLLSCDKEGFCLCWSDTSGVLRSHHFEFADPESWPVLFAYVRTICEPLEDLPTRDSTMTYWPDTPSETEPPVSPPPGALWEIRTSNPERIFNARMISGGPHHTKQTCVFDDEDANRVIKDHWCDEDLQFRETDLLEKVKGIPFVVQVDFSEEVKDPERSCEEDQTLRTSQIHSGREPMLKIGYRRVPRRRKQRSVLKSKGQPLWQRKDVCQILKAGYEGIQGHQLALIHAKILHRDISRGNILINPMHYDTKFKKLDCAVPINKVLDKTLENPKEEGMIFDLDAAADLDNSEAPRALAGRTGTPMFIAVAVGKGQIRRDFCFRGKFPEISPEAEKKYRDAYGDDVFDRYPNTVNNMPQMKNPTEIEEPAYQHAPHHDIESFFWVFLYELLVAWPEGAEEKLSPKAGDLILAIKSHSCDENGIDGREGALTEDETYFKELLHPDLEILGTMLYKMAQYMKPEWAYWESNGLPPDHAHEAFKRLLLETIILLKDNPIALQEKERGKVLNPAKVINARVSSKAHDAQTPKKGRTSNREPTEDDEPKAKKFKVSEQAPGTAGMQNSIVASGSRNIADPPSLPSTSASSIRGTKRGLVKPNMGPPSTTRSRITRSSSRRNIKGGASRQGEEGASGSAENGTSRLVRRRSSRLSNKEKMKI